MKWLDNFPHPKAGGAHTVPEKEVKKTHEYCNENSEVKFQRKTELQVHSMRVHAPTKFSRGTDVTSLQHVYRISHSYSSKK